jgi:hypothetical protein
MMEEPERITVRIMRPLHMRICTIANNEGFMIRRLIDRIIEEWLDQNEQILLERYERRAVKGVPSKIVDE